MKGRFLNLKTLLPLLVLLTAISNPAQADYDASYCLITGAPLVIRNVNLKGGGLPEGTVLQSVPLNIGYECNLFLNTYFKNYQATLYLDKNIAPLVDALKNARLAMEISISEDGLPPRKFTWKDIKNAANSGTSKLEFGKLLGNKPNPSYTATAQLVLSLSVDTGGISVTTPKNISVPASNLTIIPYNQPGLPIPGKLSWLTIPGFNINIIPDNSGVIAVVPDLIRMGHFYTGDVSSQTKQASFTVTALQKAGVGNGGTPFTIPLGITFKPDRTATLVDANKTIKLINTNGNPAGLGLSIKEDGGNAVTFNETAPMGNIVMGTGATGRVVKTYTATVAPISGETINTGDFTAAISIIVTYQ
ncbi:TPA: fimbrial protein [Salmonella enterica subsp. enterica serovar Bovismorbificans]|nr:fimbrial protein [Salmonella enterica subsp. enterica serovar Bovismorbificans]